MNGMYRPYLCRDPVGSTVADFSRRRKSQLQLNGAATCDIALGCSQQKRERVAEANPVPRDFCEAFAPAFIGVLLARPSRGKEKAIFSQMFS